jgi:hypothetical protein
LLGDVLAVALSIGVVARALAASPPSALLT